MEFNCPRCGNHTDQTYYSPCRNCIEELIQWTTSRVAFQRFCNYIKTVYFYEEFLMGVVNLVEKYRADLEQKIGPFGFLGEESAGQVVLGTAKGKRYQAVLSSRGNVKPGLDIVELEDSEV